MSTERRRPRQSGFVSVEPARRPVLFINPTSGGGKAQRARLADLARERGIEPVTLARGQDVEGLIQKALGSVGALDAFGVALERTIDLGDVNGRPFVNNVSLGMYADAVGQSGYRDAKLRTLLETAQAEALGSSSTPADVHLVDDRGTGHRSPVVVLVSNNPYALKPPPARGARPVLDGGRLGIVVIDAPAGPPHHAGRASSAPSLRVEAGGTVPAGVDGEAVALTPPLQFTVHPKALRVRVAPAHMRRRLPAR